MPHHQSSNESAATLAWLFKTLHLDQDEAASPLRSAWNDIRERMLRSSRGGQLILQSVDWVSDFWLARGAIASPWGSSFAPNWMPPARIEDWPTFGVQDVIAAMPCNANRANRQAYLNSLKGTLSPKNPRRTAAAALAQYLELKAALVPQVFDVPAVQTEHVRVWLASSLGHILMSVALTPPTDSEALNQAILYRLSLPQKVGLQQGIVDEIQDRHLELLYNSRMLPDGWLQLSRVRTGQGEEWRDHWLSLCFEVGAENTLEAVQIAARLLRCSALISGLQLGVASSENHLKELAVGVIRRWILTLEVMAWLEVALTQSWSDVRPQDLCCFALNAIKPDWPRRVVGISHRSKDVKPDLRDMRIWRAARCAIDSNYVPSWETNIGMVWGLFAATPAIVRVHSPAYTESVWCRRELELSNYLLAQSDFLTERWIVDVEMSELKKLDAIVEVWRAQYPQEATGILPQFPPLTEVCSPSPMPVWEARMFRASAALRLIHAEVQWATPELVNKIAVYLQNGEDLPGVAPTNNPDGWRAYGAIFREAHLSESGPEELAVRLPSNYNEAQRELDLQMAQRIPDLQAGSPSLRDVLVAMEWLRVEWPHFLERNRGDYLAINCQRVSKEIWTSREEVSLHRGLVAMRLSTPLWIIQAGDQDVESWPLMGEMPIFTEHVSAQFAWMMEISFERSEAQQRYPEDSGLILSSELKKNCLAGGRDGI